MPRSSSCLRMSCSAGTFFSSGSHTTTAASTAGERVSALGLANSIEPGQSRKVKRVAQKVDVGDVELDAHAVMRAASGEASPTVFLSAMCPAG